MSDLNSFNELRQLIRTYLTTYRDASDDQKAMHKDQARQLLLLERAFRKLEKDPNGEQTETPTRSEEQTSTQTETPTQTEETTPTTQEAPQVQRRSIQAAVGQGGANNKADVRLVQELLVGAGYKITVDGLIGQQTIGAIRQFQKSIFNGWSDGRVDPGGKTFSSLQQKGGGTTPPPTSDNSSTNTGTNTGTNTNTGANTSGTLQASVGKGGANNASDVTLVQTLLNKVKADLTVDGQYGGNTQSAIDRFQKSIFNGWSDGRIEPGGKTWASLQAGKGSAAPGSQPTNEPVPVTGTISGSGYQKFNNGAHIASVPNGASGALHLLLIFGGADYANPTWMVSQVPASYHEKVLIYVVPQRTGFAGARAAYTAFFKTKGVQVATVSICGFSGGGQDVQFASGNIKIKALIDPYVVPDWVNRNLGSNVIMEHNPNNWGGPYASTRTALPKLARTITRNGGYAKQVAVSHKGFPAYFFKKFASKLL